MTKTGQLKLLKNNSLTANRGLKEMAGDEQILKFVHLIYFCAGGQFCASNTSTSQSCKTLGAMLTAASS